MRSADRSRLHGAAVGRHARGLDVGRGWEACCEPRGSTASEDGNVGHDLRVYRILPRSRHDRVSKGLYSVRDSLYPRRPFVQNSPKKRSPGPVDLPQELASETGARSICRSGVTHRMDRPGPRTLRALESSSRAAEASRAPGGESDQPRATPLGARTRDLGHKHITIGLTASLRLLDYHPRTLRRGSCASGGARSGGDP